MGEDIFSSITTDDIVLPLNVLKDYADSFNKAFTEKLVLEIKKTMEDDNENPWGELISIGKKEQEEQSLVTRVFIVAPGLSNYRLLVLKLKYKISQVYPCVIENLLEEKKFDCKDAESVNKAFETIFSSDSFQRPVKMLLSQIG